MQVIGEVFKPLRKRRGQFHTAGCRFEDTFDQPVEVIGSPSRDLAQIDGPALAIESREHEPTISVCVRLDTRHIVLPLKRTLPDISWPFRK